MLTTRRGAGGHLPAGRRSPSCQETSVIDCGEKKSFDEFQGCSREQAGFALLINNGFAADERVLPRKAADGPRLLQ